MAAATYNRGGEALEVIEWDMPFSDTQGHTKDTIDFSRLSMGTEIRNRMWEDDNKIMLSNYQNRSSSSSPLFDQNQNVPNSIPSPASSQSLKLMIGSNGFSPTINEAIISSKYNSVLSNPSLINPTMFSSNASIQEKVRMRSQPLLQSPVSMPDERKTPELLSQQHNGILFDDRRVNESQTIKEELLEMKSIFTKLVAQSDDIVGLPEPVQLALKVIRLEGELQDQDSKVKSLEDTIADLKNEMHKTKEENEFELAKQTREVKFLTEKLDYKTNLDVKMKEMKQKDEKTEIEELKEEVTNLADVKEEKVKELEDYKSESEHKIKMLRFDVSNNEKELDHLKKLLNEQETNKQNKRAEIEKYITAAREAMERERQDRYLLLVEQNKLKHKVEKLSETCKSYQTKNEELCRIQNELEQECGQFRKLKKMIQEHGLPNHEQLIMLQQQTEMFKDDVLSERKDRERAQAQREKLRRDLEILQSRNQSLQEQVYKYQEHIMRLNTGDRRYQSHQEFIMQQQASGKFARQLSSPAYYNPKLRGSSNMTNPMKNPVMNGASLNKVGMTRQAPPLGDLNLNQNRSLNGFPANFPNSRGAAVRSPLGFNNGGQFDPWPQRNGIPQQLSQPPALSQRNTLSGNLNNNRAPRSPLLGPNGDPWMLPPSPNSVPQQAQLGQPGLNYNNTIWSQQAPASPTTFSNSNNAARQTGQASPTSWQFSDSPPGFSPHPNDSMKALPGGDAWSTAGDDQHTATDGQSSPSVTTDYNLAEKGESNDNVIGFQCGKCSLKFKDTESFREHAEKCFN